MGPLSFVYGAFLGSFQKSLYFLDSLLEGIDLLPIAMQLLKVVVNSQQIGNPHWEGR